jgi:hypothetical protein
MHIVNCILVLGSISYYSKPSPEYGCWKQVSVLSNPSQQFSSLESEEEKRLWKLRFIESGIAFSDPPGYQHT